MFSWHEGPSENSDWNSATQELLGMGAPWNLETTLTWPKSWSGKMLGYVERIRGRIPCSRCKSLWVLLGRQKNKIDEKKNGKDNGSKISKK